MRDAELQEAIRAAKDAAQDRKRSLLAARSAFSELERAYGDSPYRGPQKIATRARKGRELANELLTLLDS
jgi:hypothetical protein